MSAGWAVNLKGDDEQFAGLKITRRHKERKTNQMHISGLKQSKFLTRADVGRGILVTIKQIFEDNVAKEGAPPEMKWCISFHETDKPMVLNSTNGQIIAQITKSEETDTWPGHKIVLYDDPNVSFGGKLVGGIRVRAARNQAPAPLARPTPPVPVRPQAPRQPDPVELNPADDDVPF